MHHINRLYAYIRYSIRTTRAVRRTVSEAQNG